jgi:hypothetical protein
VGRHHSRALVTARSAGPALRLRTLPAGLQRPAARQLNFDQRPVSSMLFSNRLVRGGIRLSCGGPACSGGESAPRLGQCFGMTLERLDESGCRVFGSWIWGDAADVVRAFGQARLGRLRGLGDDGRW